MGTIDALINEFPEINPGFFAFCPHGCEAKRRTASEAMTASDAAVIVGYVGEIFASLAEARSAKIRPGVGGCAGYWVIDKAQKFPSGAIVIMPITVPVWDYRGNEIKPNSFTRSY